MGIPKLSKTEVGKEIHFSAGAVIKKDGKYLLVERNVPPSGFAGPAGHIDEGEYEIQAVIREVKEETGLDFLNPKLLFEEQLDWNWCSKGIGLHHWYLFSGEVSGDIQENERETKSIGWYSEDQIRTLELEDVWKYWFKKLGVI